MCTRIDPPNDAGSPGLTFTLYILEMWRNTH